MLRLLFPLLIPILCLSAADSMSLWRGDQAGRLSGEPLITTGDTSGKGVRWKTELPSRGMSSVVVAQGLVLLTCEPDTVVALDAGTGAIRWQTVCRLWTEKLLGVAPAMEAEFRTAYAEILRLAATAQGRCPESVQREQLSKALRGKLGLKGDPPGQGDFSGACPTPVVADDTVVARFGCGILAGLDLKSGAIRWELADWRVGQLDTPVLHEGLVVMMERAPGKGKGGQIAAYEARSGKLRYQTAIGDFDFHHQHASLTPMVIAGRTVLFAQNGLAVDAASGVLLGTGLFGGPYEIVPAGEILIVAATNGYKPDNSSVSAYRPNLTDSSLQMPRLWELAGRDYTCSATPVCDGTYVYLPNGRKRIQVVALANGQDVTASDQPYNASGHAWTPPLLVTGKLLVCASAAGPITFHQLGPKLDPVGSIDLSPTVKQKAGTGHPAIVDGLVFARDHFTAWCFGP